MKQAGVIDAMSINEALQMQFRLVDCIHRHFHDGQFLDMGDMGIHGIKQPMRTAVVEETLADFFKADACVLTRGAGTGAIRLGLEAIAKTGDCMLAHTAPIYPSTKNTIESMGLQCVSVNYNEIEEIKKAAERNLPKVAIAQHTRQSVNDKYALTDVIEAIHSANETCCVLVDDNYAVLRDPIDGIAAGADLSAFSLFKLQGSPGIGCLLGKQSLVDSARARICTGGTQVQGFEAMECLRGLVNSPVAFAIQAEQSELIKKGIEVWIQEGYPQIVNAMVVNMQSRVVLVKFSQPIAQRVIEAAATRGASPRPIGAESKYEIPALFYHASRTFLADCETNSDHYLRINAMRAGAETVLRILKESITVAIQED